MEICNVFSDDYYYNIPQGLICDTDNSMGKEIQNIARNLLQTITFFFTYEETPSGCLR